MSIKYKILISNSLLIAISFVLSGIFAYSYFSNIFKERLIEDDKVKMRQISQQMEYIKKDLIRFSQNIITNQQVQDYVHQYYYGDDKYSQISNKFKMAEILSSFVAQRSTYIHSAILIAQNDTICFTLLPYSSRDEYIRQIVKEAWYLNSKDRESNYYFTEPHQISVSGTSAKVISIIIDIRSTRNYNEAVCELILNVFFSAFEQSLETSAGEYEDFLWIDRENKVLYRNTQDREYISLSIVDQYLKTGNGEPISIIEDTDGYMVVDQTMDNGWKFISFTSSEQLFQRTRYIFFFFIFFVLLTLVFSVLTIILVVLIITKPITELTEAMGKITEGNLDTMLQISSGDEMEILGKGFNKMIISLKENMKKIALYEKTKRRMEFNILLSQINPHFIYNVLNTIMYMASKQKNKDIVNVTQSFIKVLQEGVRVGEDGLFTTIGQEIEIVKQYISIQQYRYRGQFDVFWDVDYTLLNCRIPRTIIQPLVENSLFHGICVNDKKGSIKIKIYRRNNDIIIEISDDGVGMDKEIVQQIMKGEQSIRAGDSMHNIGLHNIIERIKYLYGEEYGVQVHSKVNKGTKVTVRIPYNSV